MFVQNFQLKAGDVRAEQISGVPRQPVSQIVFFFVVCFANVHHLLDWNVIK